MKTTDFDIQKYNELLENDADQAAYYRAEHEVPNVLYKYISLGEDIKLNNNKLQTLKNSELWFSKSNELNDPFELNGIYLDENKLESQGVPKKAIDKQKALLLNTMLLTCFTTSKNNMPMWAHYANNHHGFCIECLVTRKVAVQKVAYKNKREPIANIWLNFMHYCSEFDATKSKEAFKKIGMYRTLLLQMYFTKHDSWSYENEYRIVYPIDCHVDKGLNIKASDVGIQISKIYCGVKCKEEYINKLHAVGATIGAEVEDCQISGDDFIVSY